MTVIAIPTPVLGRIHPRLGQDSGRAGCEDRDPSGKILDTLGVSSYSYAPVVIGYDPKMKGIN